MDEELKQAIKQLITAEFAPILEQLQAGIDKSIEAKINPRLASLEDMVTAPTQASSNQTKSQSDNSETQAETGKVTMKTLQERLAMLENQLKERDAALKQASFDNALTNAVGKYPSTFGDFAKKYLKYELASQLDEVDGRWMTKQGKTVDEVVAEFFSSDLGKHLLPAQTSEGAGVPASNSKVPTGSNQPSIDDMLIQAFGA